jgi:Fe-S-cluster-containing dehydrogenase component/DMSO reductase anchor subunit
VTILSAVAAVDETPIDRYLQLQADLTAVERFSQRHDADATPVQERYYRDLIPLNRPEPGQQYAFAVDLDACTGCKACVSACHSLNGLDDDESWRSVKLFAGGAPNAPFQQTVTSACHHCVDPACLNGCPVDAYEKDPITGIVSHLDDQCIGCGYCTLTCPYEVPVLNKTRGIVRKCDMCHGRLAAGEAPACVQACPNEAISIAVVDVAAATAAAVSGSLVPGAPPSAITVPTTVYRSDRGRTLETATSTPAVRPATAHTPLAVMLVLTQLAVGAFVADRLWRSIFDTGAATAMQPFDAVVAAAAGAVALGASVLHLGRPRYCYRAVIGLRHSWLSREVVAFGAFTGLAVPYALAVWLRWPLGGRALGALGVIVAAWGLFGLACSVMIYATTHRSSWRVGTVAWKFALTAAVCGLATVVWAASLSSQPVGRSALTTLAVCMVVKLAAEAVSSRRQTALLLSLELRRTTWGRLAAGVTGGVVVPLTLAATTFTDGRTTWLGAAAVTLALVLIVCGELLERSLFFTTASPPR